MTFKLHRYSLAYALRHGLESLHTHTQLQVRSVKSTLLASEPPTRHSVTYTHSTRLYYQRSLTNGPGPGPNPFFRLKGSVPVPQAMLGKISTRLWSAITALGDESIYATPLRRVGVMLYCGTSIEGHWQHEGQHGKSQAIANWRKRFSVE